MKTAKGALVVTKGQKVSKLYRLVRNTIVARVAVTIHVESNIDNTKLWHMQLGHIGEYIRVVQKKIVKGSEDM